MATAVRAESMLLGRTGDQWRIALQTGAWNKVGRLWGMESEK